MNTAECFVSSVFDSVRYLVRILGNYDAHSCRCWRCWRGSVLWLKVAAVPSPNTPTARRPVFNPNFSHAQVADKAADAVCRTRRGPIRSPRVPVGISNAA